MKIRNACQNHETLLDCFRNSPSKTFLKKDENSKKRISIEGAPAQYLNCGEQIKRLKAVAKEREEKERNKIEKKRERLQRKEKSKKGMVNNPTAGM